MPKIKHVGYHVVVTTVTKKLYASLADTPEGAIKNIQKYPRDTTPERALIQVLSIEKNYEAYQYHPKQEFEK